MKDVAKISPTKIWLSSNPATSYYFWYFNLPGKDYFQFVRGFLNIFLIEIITLALFYISTQVVNLNRVALFIKKLYNNPLYNQLGGGGAYNKCILCIRKLWILLFVLFLFFSLYHAWTPSGSWQHDCIAFNIFIMYKLGLLANTGSHNYRPNFEMSATNIVC